MKHFPGTCLMGDVLDVLASPGEKKKEIKKRKLATAFPCVCHENPFLGFNFPFVSCVANHFNY